MGSGNFYLQPVKTNRNVKRGRSWRSLFIAGILLACLPFTGKAQPIFQGGTAATIAVCAGTSNNDITSYLSVLDTTSVIADPINGDHNTWEISVAPANGSVSGLPSSMDANGGVLTPSITVTYTPNALFTGSDPFVIKVYDQHGDTMYKTINMVVSPLPAFHIDNIPAVCAGATSTSLFYSGLTQLGSTTQTFTGGAAYSWQVPPGVSNINVDVQGAVGGNDSHSPAGTTNPGNGARVQATVGPLSTGETLWFYVGGQGGNGTLSGATGGFNGGGNASFYFFGSGGAGGGATDIRRSGSLLSNRILVAGGGGGNGWDAPGPSCGGWGGYPVAGAGCSNVGGGHAGGGNTTALSGGAGATYSGWTAGQNGSLGQGGNGSPQGISGGGGGGYYGGGGGVWSGGGGGSSFADASVTSSVTYTNNYNIGNGALSVTYIIPGTYSIVWDGAATTAGFADVTGAAFPTGGAPISITVPSTAPAGTYTGHINIANLSCTSVDYPISITINPIPDVAAIADQSYCNGTPTSPIMFSGSVPGTTFNWTNTYSSIGLAASGSSTTGISSFLASNTTALPVTSLITVTPTANGCTGTAAGFNLTVNPNPTLTSTLTPPAICDSTSFNYVPTSGTPGTSFTWYRPTITGISNATTSGIGNPSLAGTEWLDNTTSNPIVVPYTYVLAANGCLDSQNVNVTVYPSPMLSTALSAGSICNNTLFSYPPASLTSGVSFMWNRNVVAGISNTAHVGTGNPNETLNNTTTDPIAVPYQYTLTLEADSACYTQQTVIVTVNPTPMLNTPLNAGTICNGMPFTYVGTSASAGTIFSWSRSSVTGISPATNAGLNDTVNETLTNGTADSITVNYHYTLTLTGTSCSNTQDVALTVYPTPRLSTSLTPSVCDSSIFNYPPASATPGTTFTWTRAIASGISNLAGAGFGNPNEVLINTTPNPVTVPYVFSLSANGCGPYTQTVNLTVNPKPTFTSTLTPPAICDSQVFSYNPVSGTAGSIYTWDRPYIPGIYAVQQTGTGNPNQALINSTNVVVNVMYVYTITANGCSNVQTVTVPVNPTPKLNPPYAITVCSGSPFHFAPTSYTPGATFAWDRPQVPHVSPLTSFASAGTGVIDEVLTTDVLTPVTTTYVYRLGINGCTNLGTQNLRVTINPAPGIAPITTYPASTLCAGTMYQNFGTSVVVPGIEYTWTATNATVVEQGSNHQYALITFDQPGTSVVTLTSNVDLYGCGVASTYTVTVTGGESVGAPPRVVYYNGQFICLENDNSSYQWGYDDAHTLQPTTLNGEIDQNYNNANPDFTNKNYWVITFKNGCAQKSYYNAPTGIVNVNGNEVADMKVFPNPATQVLNIEVNSTLGGEMQVEVMNLLGQKLNTVAVSNNKATVDVSSLPNGCYLVDCYRNGVKIATNKFIKN